MNVLRGFASFGLPVAFSFWTHLFTVSKQTPKALLASRIVWPLARWSINFFRRSGLCPIPTLHHSSRRGTRVFLYLSSSALTIGR